MFQIRSTYDEWAPEYDEFPNGRDWPDQHLDLRSAWVAVVAYLYTQGWHGPLDAPMPYGHTEPAARYGETTIVNDAETITIFEP